MVDSVSEPARGREHLVVMFADLCDYTAFSEANDPEEMGGVRAALETLASSVIQSHGGTITQVYGDGVLAMFGYPEPHEDDARRAVEAALQLHKMVREACWPEIPGAELRLHTGIHGGLVFLREGDVVRGRYELTGDVVNTAARLSAAAGRDEIVVSASVLGGSEGFYELTPMPDELTLKGKKVRVPAYRLTCRSSAGTRYEARSRRGLTAFVGRAPLMAQLARAVQDASQGALTLSLLTGPAGIGKSRVLEELRARVATQARVLWGTCESFGALAPLEPFRQVLKQALELGAHPAEQLAQEVPAALAALGGVAERDVGVISALFALGPPAGETPAVDAALSAQALSNVVGALLRRGPVLLLLDDWQWADDSSRKTLEQVLADHARQPLAVVVAARALDFVQLQWSHARRFALEPFSEEESLQVVFALRPRELQLAVTRAIHRHAGGNPLFVEELCRSLPRHALADEQALAQFGAPTTLHGATKARVASLPRLHSQVLCAASVIGMEFSLSCLGWLIQDEALPEVLSYLISCDLIYAVQADCYRFKHGITRDVVYESILLAERRRMHEVLAHGYTESSRPEHLSAQAEALAYHYRGSGDHVRAVHYAELAGDKALAASALDRARHQYGAALSCLARLPESDALKRHWLGLSQRWAQACFYSAAPDQVEILERSARWAAELGEVRAQAQAHYLLGWIQVVLGESPAAMQQYRAALALAEQVGDQRLTVQLWANIGQAHAAACQFEPANDYLTRALDHKRERTPRGGQLPQGFAYAAGCRAALYAYVGRFSEAERDLTDALALTRDTGHPLESSLHALWAMIELMRGAWEVGLAAARRGRLLAERANLAYVLAVSSSYENYAAFKLQRRADAVEALARAVDYMVERGLGMFISLSHAYLGDALLELGDTDAAEAACQRALARREKQDELGAALALRTLARLHAGPDRARSEKMLRAAHALADTHGSQRERALTLLVEAELAQDVAALRVLREPLGQACLDFEAMGMAAEARRARELLGRANQPGDARARPL